MTNNERLLGVKRDHIREIIRFAVVGVLSVAIHYGIYLLLRMVINYNLSYIIGYIVSFVFNFVASNKYTFNTKASVKRGVGFAVAHAINFGMHVVLLNLFVEILNVDERLAPVFVMMIAVPINFFMVRFALKSKLSE